jgi:uncharacterized protein
MTTAAALLEIIHAQYRLPWFGLHGVSHWARVYENSLRLAPTTGADERILLLFALFHDARRTNEGWDEGHGRRGADLAASLRGTSVVLAPRDFDLLYHACALHTEGLTEGDPTVQTCWDADRLDLPRAGIHPRPERLCTLAGREAETIAWAADRSLRRVVPEVVSREWALPAPADAPSRPR